MKIKLILGLGAALLLAGAVWYVQGLRVDNASLRVSLAASEALAASRAVQLTTMQNSLAIMENARQTGQQRTGALQAQISQARATAQQKGQDHEAIESSVAVIIAERLNSLSQP